MRVITLNVQGIQQATERGLFDWLVKQDADVVCLQDLRAKAYQLDDAKYHPPGYQAFFFDAPEDNYSGVAIYCRAQPKAVMTGLGFELCDFHGRYIQADYEKVSIGSLLLPSGENDPEKQAIKDEFLEHMMAHMKKTLRKRRQFIFCGTWNIAREPRDVSNWYVNQKNSGFLPEERAFMREMFDELGFVDAFREVNQADRQFTWWPHYNRAFELNEGARLDYQVCTSEFGRKVKAARILKEPRFSDHAAVVIDYDHALEA
ncbi:exodeoxyribonuclease III [Balneatrix alpica]|uniref:Exodeoxyribonuclease III n=1 Tax=Balneatrix alpica TaxID=75684 RepID=A0ABV5ZA80_9GAMM|nr:exodeoxyribonuclease III [Balneatrix alpica]